jgi:hypothetical protein
MTEAFPQGTASRYLLRDRDVSYGPAFRDRLRVMGIKEVVAAPRSAGVAERQASALYDDTDDNKRRKSEPAHQKRVQRAGGEWIARIIVLSPALELSFRRQEFENENARSSVGGVSGGHHSALSYEHAGKSAAGNLTLIHN